MIKSLFVEQFRAMRKLTIPLGKKITVIVGQNATCKSTLLGMIGQPFGLKDEKTIFDKPFSTKFSEIFKFSKNNDIPGQHEYQIEFYNNSLFGKDTEHIKSYKRAVKETSHIRLVVGKTRGKGEGNLDYPVIYLGLKRTYPIGELREITESAPTLTEPEKEMFNKWYKEIFFPQEKVSPIQITSKLQKDTLAVNSAKYDYLANSAGQDNIGQILGAIISFTRLKTKLGVDYKGGILLIDELDATLFPAAQINLVDLLYTLAGKYKLQIVFTTHSLDTLEHIIENRRHCDKDTEVLYFTNVHGTLDLIVGPEMQRIRNDLNMTISPTISAPKINVYCEDAEASWFIKRLLGSSRTKNVNISAETFSGNLLITLAEKKVPEFNTSIIILDGDMKPKKTVGNVLLLPGGANPENVFRKLLESLPPEHDFWRNEVGYTKQVFEKELSKQTSGIYDDRNKMKSWFKNQKPQWGHGGYEIYKYWLEKNPELEADFLAEFDRVYEEIAKVKSVPSI
jgi:AAA15 family ATPase/GTPase